MMHVSQLVQALNIFMPYSMQGAQVFIFNHKLYVVGTLTLNYGDVTRLLALGWETDRKANTYWIDLSAD